MEIELPDGTILEAPDGADIKKVVQGYNRSLAKPARTPAPGLKQTNPAEYDPQSVAYQQKYGAERGGLAEFGRQLGLAGRYALEGLGQAGDVFAAPVREFVTNPLARAFGIAEGDSLAGGASQLADAAGLPEPETRGERIVGEASRILAGSAGAGGAATPLAKVTGGTAQKVAGALAANQKAQAASAIGSGVSGGYVREEGGGPYEQFLASLLGGVAAPAGLSAASNVGGRVATAAQKAFAPRDIAGTLKVELQRVGIDWDALGKDAQAALVKDAEKAVYSGQPINAEALRRLADYRNVGATPTVGGITQDPRAVTLEQNLSRQLANVSTPLRGPDLPQLQNQNAKRVIETLEGVAESPLDEFATGQKIIRNVTARDTAAQNVERSLYQKARDSSGRSVPLNRHQFVEEAFGNLAKMGKGAFLPAEIRRVLNDISRGEVRLGGQAHEVPFNVDTIEQYKTILATASRGSKDGNVRAAIKAVRDALENVKPEITTPKRGSTMPVTQGFAREMRSADMAAQSDASASAEAFTKARNFARQRRTWQESASFIEDALDGANPEGFVKKHVINAPVEELSKLKTTIGKDKSLVDAVRKQLIEHISRRGRLDADTTKFSSAGMNDALKQIGDRKLALFFSKSEIGKIKSAINVARYMQSQPIGSAVNNSNSAAMIAGKLADVLMRGGQRLPVVGPMVADPIRGMALNFQASQTLKPANALMVQPPRSPFVPYNSLLLAGVPSGD